jgi:hypothetical protein
VKARFLTVFALWSFIIMMAMIGVLLAPAGFAEDTKAQLPLAPAPSFTQSGKQPFHLQVEKRRMQEEGEAGTPLSGATTSGGLSGSLRSEGASLRISRDRLGLNAQMAQSAPLTAPRAGRVDSSQFNLHAGDFALPGQAASFSGTSRTALLAPIGAHPLKGTVVVKDLANFDMELIVDESLSMRKRDCPGGLSRWDWCGQQLNELSTQLTPYTPHGFTLTTFNTPFETYAHATANQLRNLFANPQFSFGTRLSLPLQARLNNYFEHRTRTSKPLLIVVITDGVPHPPVEVDRVADTLIAASQQAHSPNEVTVVFFQIGGADRFGRAFLHSIDNELTAYGARYDIVRNVPFEALHAQGLTSALVSAVRGQTQAAFR